MSLGSRMTQKIEVWARTEESDAWTMLVSDLRAMITQLSASGARRESFLLEPDVTHVCRCELSGELIAGRRVRDAESGAEYIIRVVRNHDRPPPGYARLGIAEAKAATE